MTTPTAEIQVSKRSVLKRLLSLVLLFALILTSIFVIRHFSSKQSEFTDNVATQIEQEMAENHIVISSGNGHRTVVDFKEPIIMTHGKDSRLIVHTAHLSETISIANEGLGGCDAADFCVTRFVWQRINEGITNAVDSISLGELVQQSRQLEKNRNSDRNDKE